MPRNYPIAAVKLTLKGSFTVAGGTATVAAEKVTSLISNVRLHAAGEDRVNMSLAELLQMQAFRNRRKPAYKGPASSATLAAGTYNFHQSVTIQFDVGDYSSLLDTFAYDDPKFTFRYGGSPSDKTGGNITKGADYVVANGAATVNFNATLAVQPISVAGFADGFRGGREVAGRLKYHDRFYEATSFDLKQGQDTIIEIPQDRLYDAILLDIRDASGNPKAVAGFIQDTEYRRLEARPFKLDVNDAEDFAVELNTDEYTETSVIVPPFFQAGHSETFLSTLGRKRPEFVIKTLTNPTAGDHVRMLMGYFVGGPTGAGRFRKLPGEK